MERARKAGDRDDGAGSGRGVLEGAFGLLDELARLGEAGLTQLATRVGIPKATAHRLLSQLARLGAVHCQDGRYQVGPELFRLGQAWQPAPLLRAVAHRPLRELAAVIPKASICMGMPAAGRTVIVGGIPGEVNDVFPLRSGLLLPPGCPGDRVFALDSAPAAVPESYSAREWKRIVADVRTRELAVDEEAIGLPVSCVSAPVHTPTGKIIAEVGASSLDRRRLPAITEAVRRAARMVSANLARRPARDPSLSRWLGVN